MGRWKSQSDKWLLALTLMKLQGFALFKYNVHIALTKTLGHKREKTLMKGRANGNESGHNFVNVERAMIEIKTRLFI